MKLIRGIDHWPLDTPVVATIGNFDGLHRGHQAMLATLVEEAGNRQLPSVVMSFSPYPWEFFAPEGQATKGRIQGFRDRVTTLSALGVDYFLRVPFDAAFAALSAEQFIDDILLDTLKIRFLIVGDDFRFGRGREGDLALLQQAADRANFTLASSGAIADAAGRISSSRVRDHLARAEFDAAEDLLGRPYVISGRVVHGEKVGRTLGFPTANVALGRHQPIPRGVFAVRASIIEHGVVQQAELPAVANLGVRPTVDGHKLLFEVHLLDAANTDLYGKHLAVEFRHRIRDEQRFDSLDALKAQIVRDATAAKTLLQAGGNGCG